MSKHMLHGRLSIPSIVRISPHFFPYHPLAFPIDLDLPLLCDFHTSDTMAVEHSRMIERAHGFLERQRPLQLH